MIYMFNMFGSYSDITIFFFFSTLFFFCSLVPCKIFPSKLSDTTNASRNLGDAFYYYFILFYFIFFLGLVLLHKNFNLFEYFKKIKKNKKICSQIDDNKKNHLSKTSSRKERLTRRKIQIRI